MRQFTRHLKIALFTLICLCMAPYANAHELLPAIVDIKITQNGSMSLDIETNAEALLAEIGPGHDNTENTPNADVYVRFREKKSADLSADFAGFAADLIAGIGLTINGENIPLQYEGIDVPEVGDTSLARQSIIQLSAQLPADAETLKWSWDQEFGASIIRLDDANGEPYSAFILEGMSSEDLAVSGAQPLGFFASILDFFVTGFKNILP